MWKKIDNFATIAGLELGNIIAENPDNQEECFEVVAIHAGYVKAFHANGRLKLKVFPEEQLMNHWWVKKE